jgi:hypothetical protein
MGAGSLAGQTPAFAASVGNGVPARPVNATLSIDQP